MVIYRHTPHQKYYLSDGRQVVGASTPCKLGDDTGGLIHWAWKLGKEGKDYRTERDSAANIGTVCHAMIEAWLKQEELDYSDFFSEDSEEAKKARKGFDKFRIWWDENKFTFLFSELPLVSEAYEYGGTLDIIALDGDQRRTLIDIKATNSIREAHYRQLSAYEHLNNENFPDEWIERRAIARVGKTDAAMQGKFLPTLDRYFDTFKVQLQLLECLKMEHL